MSYNLTLTSATFNASGKFGQSLNGGYGSASNPIPASGPFTIEAWAKNSGGTGYQVIAGSHSCAWIGQTADGKARGFYGSNDVIIDSTIAINDGAWHHISFNIDPQGAGSTLYVDGVLAGANPGKQSVSLANPFGVRAWGDSTPGQYLWTGEVDEVAIYSGVKRTAAFTPPTVSTPNTDTGLLALWHLDGNGTDSVVVVTPTTPGAPTGLVLTAGDGSISGTFNAPASDGGALISSYVVTLSTGETKSTSVTSFSFTGLSNGVTRTATVHAVNSAGPGPESAISNSVTTNAIAAGVSVSISDTKLVWSPYNWDNRTTYSVSNTPGAYLKLAFTGTSVAVNVDVSAMVAANISSASYPMVRTVVDGLLYADLQLNSSTTNVARTGLSAGSHTLEFYFLGADINLGDRWNTPVNAIRVTGITLAAGAVVNTYTKRSKVSLHFADSIGEGFLSLGTVNSGPLGNSSMHTIHPYIAQAFDCEYGVVAFSGQGYQQSGADVPPFPSAYGLYSAGRSRLVAGKFVPAPDYIFVEHGANGSTGSTDVSNMIANLRAAAPLAKILMFVPRGGYARSAITAGVSSAADPNAFLVDLGADYQTGLSQYGTGPNMYSLDGLHPNVLSNAKAATAYSKKSQAALDVIVQPTLTARQVSVTLGDSSGLLANLTGLKVAFYDEPTPDLHSVPRYKTAAGTTNASGVISFTAQSTLASGGTGCVVIQMADGRNLVASVVVV